MMGKAQEVRLTFPICRIPKQQEGAKAAAFSGVPEALLIIVPGHEFPRWKDI
jgi:hypothetical protein